MVEKNYNLDDIHKIQIDLLKEFHRVCEKNGLKYYLACGTCIGALRHHGFIPWDDDVDVYMYYDDVEKLKKLQEEFVDGYFIQHVDSDPEFKSTILRIRDSRTTCIEAEEENLDINHGFFMDVYPLYYAPQNVLTEHIYIFLSYIYRILVMERIPFNHGNLAKILATILLNVFRGKFREWAKSKIKKMLLKPMDTDEVLTYYGLDITLTRAIKYRAEWFKEPTTVTFEGENVCAPTRPKAYLNMKYGDYTKLPPKEEQVPHHSFVYADTNNPYTKYKGIYYK